VSRPGVALVALDVDGTVLTPDGRIAPSTRAAVAQARERSVRIVLASSRGPVALERIQAGLGLQDEWFVGFQGALVARRTRTGLEVLDQTRIEPGAAGEVEALALALGLSIGRYAGLRWRVPRLTDAIRREAAETGERPVLSTPEESAADEAPHKLAAIADGNADALPRLAAQLPATVTATLSHPDFLEITAAGVDKGTGLRALGSALGIPAARTAAVGDGPNDLGMFAAVGHPVAMGQAPPAVRAAAGWVTTGNADDGVARALEHLGVLGDAAAGAHLRRRASVPLSRPTEGRS
jgi:Cof subfamily protein (haloacid dehalogenase superfamily)